MFVFFCGLLCVCGWHWLTIYLAMHLLYSVVLLVACEFYGECFFSPTLDLPDLPIQSKRILAPVAWPYLCFRLHFVFPCFSTITIHLTNLSCSRHSLMIWNRPCFYCMPFGNLIFECTSLGDLLQIVWQNDLFVCFLYVRCTRHCKNHSCRTDSDSDSSKCSVKQIYHFVGGSIYPRTGSRGSPAEVDSRMR